MTKRNNYNPYNLFKTDSELETKGVILDYGEFRIKIARAGGANKTFSTVFNERTKAYKHQQQLGVLSDEVAEEILIGVYADSVILNMEVLDHDNSNGEDKVYIQGILDPEGDILPYNRKNVMAFFHNLPELFKDVQTQSMEMALFRAAQLENEIKNSEPISSGD